MSNPEQLIGNILHDHDDGEARDRSGSGLNGTEPASYEETSGIFPPEGEYIDDLSRSTAEYFAFYYSQRPIDTSLPPPLMSWEQYAYHQAERQRLLTYMQMKLARESSHEHEQQWPEYVAGGGGSGGTRGAGRTLSVFDRIQEDFPSTPSPVLNQSGGIPIAMQRPESAKQFVPVLPDGSHSAPHLSPQYIPSPPHQTEIILNPLMNGLSLDDRKERGATTYIPSDSAPPVSEADDIAQFNPHSPITGHPLSRYYHSPPHIPPQMYSPQPMYLASSPGQLDTYSPPRIAPDGSPFGYDWSVGAPYNALPYPAMGDEMQMSMAYPGIYPGTSYMSSRDARDPSRASLNYGPYYRAHYGRGGHSPIGNGERGRHNSMSKTPERSALLDEFRNSVIGKLPKVYEIKALVGHIVEFSRDQHGSRFIQLRIGSGPQEERELVFKEIEPHALSLMSDVFGNYVIQKLFEHGSSAQRIALCDALRGKVFTLSLQMYGCRVVQRALEFVDEHLQASIVKELEGHVFKCVKDQNGNHVVQKVIETVPFKYTQFIVDTFVEQVYSLATHPYGCRVIQRILEKSSVHTIPKEIIEARKKILQELKANVIDLVLGTYCDELYRVELPPSLQLILSDQYGNYVIQHVLENGTVDDCKEIVERLRGNIVTLAQHKFASNVIEKSIQYSSPDVRFLIIEEILRDLQGLSVMMKDMYANYVIQKVLDLADSTHRDRLLDRIREERNSLKQFPYGKHILSHLEKLESKPDSAKEGVKLDK